MFSAHNDSPLRLGVSDPVFPAMLDQSGSLTWEFGIFILLFFFYHHLLPLCPLLPPLLGNFRFELKVFSFDPFVGLGLKHVHSELRGSQSMEREICSSEKEVY